ncbi:MAG: hypothetical protein Q9164_005793 [Protoblastenia rupestris]
MTTTLTTSKPQSQLPPPSVATPSPGSWRHPQFDEIARRQRANTFNDGNVRRIVYNGIALAALIYASLHKSISTTLTTPPINLLTTPTFFICMLVVLYNILTATLPLVRTSDNLTDIPLTPTQRALLGLDPTATPPLTPGTRYTTPPRYPRSPTPRNLSGTPRNISGGVGTPSSRKGSPLAGTTDRGDSPTASPLWQKSKEVARRGSYGSPSQLGLGMGGGNERSILGRQSGTPSPTGGMAGRGATVGLNSKWLYEKGRRGSGVHS